MELRLDLRLSSIRVMDFLSEPLLLLELRDLWLPFAWSPLALALLDLPLADLARFLAEPRDCTLRLFTAGILSFSCPEIRTLC